VKKRQLTLPRILCLTILVTALAGCSDSNDERVFENTENALVVNTTSVLRPINRKLSGLHARASAESIANDFGDLAVQTHRHVISLANFLHYDCESKAVDQDSLDYFNSWLDAVDAGGADAILSLSYVPECAARDGQTKGPPVDEVIYREFLNELLSNLVTERAALGKKPLEYLELWNEPDVPINAGALSSGHGFVGTLDEFVATMLPHLSAAVIQAESDSGVDIQIGAPASYAPWPTSRYVANMFEFMSIINGYDDEAAELFASLTDVSFPEPHTPPASERIIHYGGIEWPRRIIDEAANFGLDVEFVSVHLYPNSPLLGAVPLGDPEPQLTMGRNPFASPNQYEELAQMWSGEFPTKELMLSEWALSAGNEFRRDNCEGAAFNAASLSVMQASSIDRALYLLRPFRPADAAMRTWPQLPKQQVMATLPTDIQNIWVTAASDESRTTVLLSQWHTRLEDATDITFPTRITGLVDGAYQVDIEWIGAGNEITPGFRTMLVQSRRGVLALPEDVRMPGQSVVRLDIRASGVAPLTVLTESAVVGLAGPCIL
jgi:hypothetical protein